MLRQPLQQLLLQHTHSHAVADHPIQALPRTARQADRTLQVVPTLQAHPALPAAATALLQEAPDPLSAAVPHLPAAQLLPHAAHPHRRNVAALQQPHHPAAVPLRPALQQVLLPAAAPIMEDLRTVHQQVRHPAAARIMEAHSPILLQAHLPAAEHSLLPDALLALLQAVLPAQLQADLAELHACLQAHATLLTEDVRADLA